MSKKVPDGAHNPNTASKRKWKDPGLGAMEPVDGKLPLAWRFSHCDKGGPFSWLKLSSNDISFIMRKIPEFETKSWDDLHLAKCHPIPVSQLEKDARNRLSEIEHDDLDLLMVFHLSGPKRLWCIQQGNLMRVLWWDPEHKVYKTERDRADRVKRKLRSR